MMPTQTKALLTSGPVTADHKKARRTTELFRAMFNKAELSEEDTQFLNENPDFPSGLLDLIKRCSVSNQYANEEVKSNYGYLSGYTKPKDVIMQSNRLRELFPGVGFHDAKAAEAMQVPEGAEGLFVIPRWQSLARSYLEAVQVVLAKLKETRKGAFYNYREDEMGLTNLRQHIRKAEAMDLISEQQKGYDLLVIPAQFGIVHRGRSVRRARVVIGGKGFGLGAFEVGIMLLTHPERLQHYDDLWIDCAGDEFKPSDESAFGCAPLFKFNDGKLEFGAYWFASANDYYGSASAVFPQ